MPLLRRAPSPEGTAQIEAGITVTEDGTRGEAVVTEIRSKTAKKQQQADHTARIFYFRATYTYLNFSIFMHLNSVSTLDDL